MTHASLPAIANMWKLGRGDRLLEEVAALCDVARALHRAERHSELIEVAQTAHTLVAQAPVGERRSALEATLNMFAGFGGSALRDDDGASAQFAVAKDRFSAINNRQGIYLAVLAEAIRLQEAGEFQRALESFREAEAFDRDGSLDTDSAQRYALQCNIVGCLVALGDTGAVITQVDDALRRIPPEPCKEYGPGCGLRQKRREWFSRNSPPGSLRHCR
jgi:hypothetical protein